MPHTSTPPLTTEEILATANPDPAWQDVLETLPLPRGVDYDLEMLKDLSAATYPRMKKMLDASRPTSVTEKEISINIPSTTLTQVFSKIRAILVHPKTDQQQEAQHIWPVMLLFHSGGHTVGTPEQELPLARQIAQNYQVMVVLPAYRLAPENLFPTSFGDCLETLKQVANDMSSLCDGTNKTNIIPTTLSGNIKRESPLLIGGTSAGAGIAASLVHLYHQFCNTSLNSTLPSITGVLFSCGTILDATHVPSAYRPYFQSRDQNASTLPLDKDLLNIFYKAGKPNKSSTIWASLDQHPEQTRERVGEDYKFLKDGNVRVYVQVCGADISRDDSLIYERMLREEAGVETRLDLYAGFGHVFWGMSGPYGELEMSKKRMSDTVDAVGWLLRQPSSRSMS